MSEHTPAPYAPRAVYGFAMKIGSEIVLYLYLLWAFVPDKYLHEKLGLTYLPSKYWAVALPIYVLTAVALFVFAIYPAINMILTPDIGDIRTITDEHCLKLPENIIPGGVPPVSDIPITEVCKRLYLKNDKIKI